MSKEKRKHLYHYFDTQTVPQNTNDRSEGLPPALQLQATSLLRVKPSLSVLTRHCCHTVLLKCLHRRDQNRTWYTETGHVFSVIQLSCLHSFSHFPKHPFCNYKQGRQKPSDAGTNTYKDFYKDFSQLFHSLADKFKMSDATPSLLCSSGNNKQ